MLSVGKSKETIARVLGIKPAVLRRHYKEDFKTGADIIEARLAVGAITQAMAGDGAMTRYVLDRKFGWNGGAAGKGSRPGELNEDDAPAYVPSPEEADAFAAVEEAIRSRSGGHIGSPEVGGDSEA